MLMVERTDVLSKNMLKIHFFYIYKRILERKEYYQSLKNMTKHTHLFIFKIYLILLN